MTRFRVNTAAAAVPGQACTVARSSRPLALMPARVAEKANPPGRKIFSETSNETFMLLTLLALRTRVARVEALGGCRVPWRPRRSTGAWDSYSNPCKAYRGLLHGRRRKNPCVKRIRVCG